MKNGTCKIVRTSRGRRRLCKKGGKVRFAPLRGVKKRTAKRRKRKSR